MRIANRTNSDTTAAGMPSFPKREIHLLVIRDVDHSNRATLKKQRCKKSPRHPESMTAALPGEHMTVRKLAILSALFTMGGCVSSNYGPVAYANNSDFTIKTTAVRGYPLTLYFTVEVNPDCTRRGEPVIQILEAPVNGSVTVAKARDYPNFRPPNERTACNKFKYNGKRLIYHPHPDFVGTDNVLIDEIASGGSVKHIRYVITVR